jgi:hypothetical protein
MTRKVVAHGEIKNLVAWSAIPYGFPQQYYHGFVWECHLCGKHEYSEYKIKQHLSEHGIKNIVIDDLNRVWGEEEMKN